MKRFLQMWEMLFRWIPKASVDKGLDVETDTEKASVSAGEGTSVAASHSSGTLLIASLSTHISVSDENMVAQVEPHLSEDQRKIMDFCRERGITEVVHFTHSDNLPSIFEHGLLSVNDLKDRGIEYRFNDQHRIEGMGNAICLSISFPNYKMFFKYKEYSKSFVVISLHPRLLWELKCIFCPSNASSTEVLRLLRHHREQLTGLSGLENMFSETPLRNPNIRRSRLNIPPHYTTDPQAEVLCLEPIPCSYIQAIYHDGCPNLDEKVGDKWRHLLKQDSRYFGPREDWAYWIRYI